jgi:hypothetical protein
MAIIDSARFNNLQSRIELILGNGAGQNGYGQSLASANVTSDGSEIVEAVDINNIYSDMLRARVHQVGPNDLSIAQIVQNRNIVAEDESFFVDDDGTTSVDAEGSKKGLADFEDLMTDIETDKFIVHTSQATLESSINSVRTTAWNGTIVHEFAATFNSEDHRRHFFNTGGQIRFNANNTLASTPKGLDWAELCSEVGTVIFDYNSTTSTGDGSGSSIGNYDLDGSEQIIYQKVGAGSYSGIYAGNLYTIKARLESVNRIIFRVEFNDVVTDPVIDNNVDGRLESVIQHYRATGEYVSVEAPSYFNENTLA